MIKKINFLVVAVCFFVSSCSSEDRSKQVEYKFEPIGWSFKLPDNWVAQKNYNIDAIAKKYNGKLGLTDERIAAFHQQKIFMLETKIPFNKFTSEISAFDGDLSNFATGYRKQLTTQMGTATPETEIESGDVIDISIGGVNFKQFDVTFRFDKKNSEQFYMQVFMGLFDKNMLLVSFTCIQGNDECKIIKNSFESSVFEKI